MNPNDEKMVIRYKEIYEQIGTINQGLTAAIILFTSVLKEQRDESK